ncbi:hypothetical protein ZWY2020_002598 [Hordeum vulgare]|nr:hypothetical protein ZWY2020_002598 [Hordeum vulgare]
MRPAADLHHTRRHPDPLLRLSAARPRHPRRQRRFAAFPPPLVRVASTGQIPWPARIRRSPPVVAAPWWPRRQPPDGGSPAPPLGIEPGKIFRIEANGADLHMLSKSPVFTRRAHTEHWTAVKPELQEKTLSSLDRSAEAPMSTVNASSTLGYQELTKQIMAGLPLLY